MSSRELFSCRVVRGVERRVVPTTPDDPNPGTCQDADCVGVSTSSGDGLLVDPHSPGIAQTAAIREIHDCCAELLVTRPPEHGLFAFAGLASRG